VYCRSCGQQVNDSAVFCRGCGSRVLGTPDPGQVGVSSTLPSPPRQAEPPASSSSSAHGALPPQATHEPSTVVVVAIVMSVVTGLGLGGIALWRTGVADRFLKPPMTTAGPTKAGTANASTAATASERVGVSGSISASAEPTRTAETPRPSDSESYSALLAEWDTISRLRADYGEPTAGAAKGVGTGWLYDTWSVRIGDRRVSVTARARLRDASKKWVDRFTKEKARFAALRLSSRYSRSRDQLSEIYDTMIARADLYYRTAAYAVDHPSTSKGNDPWRKVQRGASGNASGDALKALEGAVAAYETPVP
jgi:hypothetical protein